MLAHGGQREHVGARQERRHVIVVVPAGKEDAAHAEPGDRVGGVFPLPLARMAADDDEAGGSLALMPSTSFAVASGPRSR